MFAKVVLIFFGLSFGGFGVWALIAPASLAKLVHFSLDTPGAMTEIRAFYGGLEIGFAAFLIAAAFVRPLVPGALLALVAIAGGIALARLVGIVVDGSGSTFMYSALVWELAGAGLGLLAWLQVDHG
ncbi:MAG: DUF4345 family protein [Gammaproteobacteria bacterium]